MRGKRQAHRLGALTALAMAGGACTQLGDIQQTPALMSLQFSGSHTTVAECVHRRLGGRMIEERPAERFVVYDSVKGDAGSGLSHYAITVGRSGSDSGFAEWRVMAPASSGRFGRNAVTARAVQTYWNPVEDCARRQERPR